jgi:hypothetical protein
MLNVDDRVLVARTLQVPHVLEFSKRLEPQLLRAEEQTVPGIGGWLKAVS